MLSKKHRLKKESDFKAVFQKGKYFRSGYLSAKWSKNSLDFSRFGFIVSSKVSKKAVERNLIRRWLSSTVEENLNTIGKGFDVVIIVKPEAKQETYQKFKLVLMNILKEIL